MDAGLLDVLHDAADVHGLAVAHRVDVHLDGTFQEAVEQDRMVGRDARRLGHVVLEVLLVVGDDHPAPAEDVRGPHEQREADPARDLDGLVVRVRGARRRVRDLEPVEHLGETPPVLGEIDRLRLRAHDRHTGCLEGACELEGRLPAEGHDDAGRPLGLDDVHHVFEGERLEVEAVGGVVVGGDGLGVAVHHDRLEAALSERVGRVHAAVVELDALPDTVGPSAEDHRLRPVARRDLVFVLVGLVVVGRRGRELRGAGVDRLERRPHSQTKPRGTHLTGLASGQVRDLHVRQAVALRLEHLVARQPRQARARAAPPSASAMPSICLRNQESMCVSSNTSCTLRPRRNASAM